MHDLVFSLTFRAIEAQINQLLECRLQYQKFMFVIQNPVIFRSLQLEWPKCQLPGVEFYQSSQRMLSKEGGPLVFISDRTFPEEIFYETVFCLPDDQLVGSVPRAVQATLEYTGADDHLDSFDAQATRQLRQVLQLYGLIEFLRSILHIVNVSGAMGESDRALQEIKERYREKKNLNLTNPSEKLQTIEQFFSFAETVPSPHAYVKYCLSYYTYIKSNRNISKASNRLKISRTTLHKHLLRAKDSDIPRRFGFSSPDDLRDLTSENRTF